MGCEQQRGAWGGGVVLLRSADKVVSYEERRRRFVAPTGVFVIFSVKIKNPYFLKILRSMFYGVIFIFDAIYNEDKLVNVFILENC